MRNETHSTRSRPGTPRRPIPPQKPPREEADESDDAATILSETGRMPDRDQLFDSGHESYPPPNGAPTADFWSDESNDWSGDIEDEVKGERSLDTDAVDELRGVEGIVGQVGDRPSDEPLPPQAARADVTEYARLSDEELRHRADALGVAGREEMSRIRLIEAIRAATQRTTE